jgi:alpha-amylase
MSSYYFVDTDAGPPSVGVSGGKYCADGKNWVCEHRYLPVANMVNWKNVAGTSPIANWQVGTANQIAFSRAGAAFVAFNRETSASWKATLITGLPAGTYCNVALNDANADNASSCSVTVTVDSTGKATVQVPPFSVVAIHVNAKK